MSSSSSPSSFATPPWSRTSNPPRQPRPRSRPRPRRRRAAEAHPGFLYGRITAVDGATYEGRLRWGGDQEAFWGDYFNGAKDENPWAVHAPLEQRPKERSPIEIFGFRSAAGKSAANLGRQFMARFGDIARIEAHVGNVPGDAFKSEPVDFSPGGSGPAYGDFPPGRPLTGSVTTRDGRRLAGRLVYDFDESETTETLDAPSQGVDYTIPFGLIASIVPPGREERGAQRATVTLHNGEELQLERTGDLGEGNAGMLIFVDGRERPEYVPWTDVEQVDFDRPPAMYPPPGGR